VDEENVRRSAVEIHSIGRRIVAKCATAHAGRPLRSTANRSRQRLHQL